jgi:hypothetical protein
MDQNSTAATRYARESYHATHATDQHNSPSARFSELAYARTFVCLRLSAFGRPALPTE